MKNVKKFTYTTEDEVINAAMHIMEAKMKNGESYESAYKACEYFRLRLGHLEREVFSVMFLNNQHQIITTEDVFFGTIDGAAVYPREIVKLALRHNAAACLFSHNHPSGTVEPSSADKQITRRIKEVLDLIDVRVLDHIIVSATETVSFAEMGLL